MAKKPNLAAVLAANEAQPERPVEAQETPSAPISAAKTPKARKSGRAGQHAISGWFDTPVKLTLDELRVKRQRDLSRRVTVQELLGEAFNDLFKKYGLPEVAPTEKRD